jgi:hypothetical protein
MKKPIKITKSTALNNRLYAMQADINDLRTRLSQIGALDKQVWEQAESVAKLEKEVARDLLDFKILYGYIHRVHRRVSEVDARLPESYSLWTSLAAIFTISLSASLLVHYLL